MELEYSHCLCKNTLLLNRFLDTRHLFCTAQRATAGFYSNIAVPSLLHPQCQIRAVESGALTFEREVFTAF